MALRKRAGETKAPENSAEAKELARDVRDRAARLRGIPGLLDGGLEELRGSLERVLRDYEKISRRRLGPFQRELEAIAKRAGELADAGHLAPRHKKIVTQALQHARRIHFWNARRALGKLEKALEPARSWSADLEAYRAFHRKAAQRVRDAEEALATLRQVPKPPVSADDVAAMKTVIEACNRAADDAWSQLTHRPVAEAVKDLAGHPDVDGLALLAVQEFAALRELSDLLETDGSAKDAVGSQTLAQLVGTSEYSSAKWDRVYPQAAHLRKRLQDLLHQVRPVVGGKYGIAFVADAPVAMLERRLGAWRRFPGAEASPAWTSLAELRASGQIPQVQEGSKIYEKFGDSARRAWEGSLAEEIEAEEKELAAAKKALAGLPGPDTLGP